MNLGEEALLSEGVKDVYEYSHPIINNALAVSVSEQQGKEVRRFPTLADWYDVINDYEFQSRCPIILKNSHRNKHFTFACHLKNCPFKILLSYSNPGSQGYIHGDHERSVQHMYGRPKTDDDDTELGENHNEHQHGIDDADLKYHDVDDPQVTAAIAAAVAAVGKDPNEAEQETTNEPERKEESEAEQTSQSRTPGRPNSNAPETIKGPFVVTKIIPYHDHPVQSNLSLDKFVLTKIPRILQNELNFDDVLETLVAEGGDGDVAKFRVSEYVEHSGLLDIIKARYDLLDSDITKKFLSQIARRVTTYKARFVLRKKKYGLIKSDRHPVKSEGLPAIETRTTRVSRTRRKRSIDEDESEIAQEALKRTLPQMLGQDDEHRQMTEEEEEEQARKLARLGEDSELHSHNQESENSSNQNSGLTDVNPLVSIDEVPDDKLPREVAEQLRLLSSHFKDVENQNLQEEEGKKNSAEISDENIQPELRGE